MDSCFCLFEIYKLFLLERGIITLELLTFSTELVKFFAEITHLHVKELTFSLKDSVSQVGL